MKTVLIVEDEKMIRQGIKTMVLRSGVPVEVVMECANGETALEILKSQKVDVMFTDIRMPKMDGIELVQKMQELPDKPLTVAVSGYDDFSYAVEMMRQGVREYILKPVERQKIQEILQKFEDELSRSQAERLTSKRLGYQQLKYLMLNEQITEEELSMMQEEYEEKFCQNDYYLCCLNLKDTEKTREQYIYLHNIAGNDVYLVPEENLNFLLKNELSGDCVGISGKHCGIREVRTAYLESLRARKRAFCTGYENCRFGEERKEVPQALREEAKKLLEPEARMKRVQLLGTDKTQDVKKIWEAFFAAAEKERITEEEFENGMSDFFPEVKKTYRNVLLDEEELLKQLENYWNYPCLAKYKGDFMEWLLGVHEKINSQFEVNQNIQKIQQAVEYMKENYAKDLNMAVVSNHVSMNYTLFSYSFKQYTGNNFVNYLKNIRMEEAGRLLADTDLRVIEISQMVGYENEKHFMKVFKTHYGVSPSEYRKNANRSE